MSDDQYPEWPKQISTPLQLRAIAQARMNGFEAFHVGTPNVGPMHRSIMLNTESHRPVKADIVLPKGDGTFPVMVFVHGGGWVMGDLNTHHRVVQRFAEQGFVVVAVDYGLAPEEPFPAGYDDVVAAIRWTLANIESYKGIPDRLVLVGDSAGANIAAGVAASEPTLPIKAIGLVYGVFDFEHMPTSPEIHADDFLKNLHAAYLGPDVGKYLKDPRVSPIHAAGKLPPTILAVGTSDLLVTESQALGARLKEAGIPYEHIELPEYNHAFLHFETMPETLPTISKIATFLHKYSA